MKICFIICGQPRSIDLTLINIEKLFEQHEIYYNICLTNNFKSYEKEYLNSSFNLQNIITNKNLKQMLLVNDVQSSEFRNYLNYTNKIKKIINVIENDYDLFILIRSDFTFCSIDFLSDIIDDNCLYLSTNTSNKLIVTKEKLNDNIIITKNFSLLCKLKLLYDFSKENKNFLEINLFNFLKNNQIQYYLININYNLILSRCNMIAISGDSGSGKSTLMRSISKLFNNNFTLLETDRYHKWERGNINYFQYTHLNPYANNLDKMNIDIYNLKIGNNIYAVDYDHLTGKFTPEKKIESKNNIILCGLHTLYNDITNNIIDIKIYMDTDRETIKKWKIKRDVEERGYLLEEVLKHIESRDKDYLDFIDKQKDNADIIVKFYEKDKNIVCDVIIKNTQFISKFLLVPYENQIFEENMITINLKYNIYENINDIINKIIN